MNEVLYGKKEELTYLEKLSEQKLTDWVKGVLAENHFEPLHLSGKNTYNSTLLLQYYFLSSNNDFKKRFEKTILKLVNSWRESTDSLDYLAEILAIAARIRIDDTYSRLLVLAKKGSLKGRTGLGVDLHCQILRVLFGFGMDENRGDLELIIDRDIEDPRYAPLCFRRSWELEFRRGIDNLPRLLKLYHEDNSIDIEGALERFLGKLGRDGFKKAFLNILQKLDDPYYTDFCDILDSIGIVPSPTFYEEKQGFIIYLKEENYFFFIEIPPELEEILKNPIEAICYWINEKNKYSDLDRMIPEKENELQMVRI